MRTYSMLALFVSLLVTAACSAPGGGKTEMKTYTKTAPGAKVTVVHYGAPW